MAGAIRAVSVVGLGKLGACLAAVLAAAGLDVVGVDVDPAMVEAINSGEAPVFEPGLRETIVAARQRLRATSNMDEAVAATDATVILVPTPSDPDGAFSLRHVLAAAGQIGRALRAKQGRHLVVLTSTVLPGTTDGEVVPLLEATSGKRCGQDFGVCYSPEFIALGTVLHDMRNPDFLLIGESDREAGDAWERVLLAFCENNPPVARTAFVNAELAKISVNTYVTMKISFANTLAAVCEQLQGADVDAVTNIVGLDSRIGKRYLKGALGYGGPCFPRDNKAFSHLARSLGQEPLLAEATDAYNELVPARLLSRISQLAQPGSSVAVLGLAYKPGTNVVEQSQGLLIAQRLAQMGYVVTVHDPVAVGAVRLLCGDQLSYAETAADAVEAADVIVIANPEPEYVALDLSRRKGAMVVDAWRVLEPAAAADGRLLVGQGRPPQSPPK